MMLWSGPAVAILQRYMILYRHIAYDVICCDLTPLKATSSHPPNTCHIIRSKMSSHFDTWALLCHDTMMEHEMFVILLLLYLCVTHTDHFFHSAHAVVEQNSDSVAALLHSSSICVAEFKWCSYICLKLGDNDRLKIVRR